MFKLESYVTPYITQYLGHYIKDFNPKDFQISILEGWVKLENLDLNLEVLESEANIPLKFHSGHLHSLKITVPWTQALYEPVRIRGHGLEIVAELNGTNPFRCEKQGNQDEVEREAEPLNANQPVVQEEALAVPTPSYLQSLLNKVVNNINFEFDDVLVSYTAGDVAFSLHIQKIKVGAVDGEWKDAFVDIIEPEFVLRRKLEIQNLTICLEQKRHDGKFVEYQEPILYRCDTDLRVSQSFSDKWGSGPVGTKVELWWKEIQLNFSQSQALLFSKMINLTLGALEGGCDNVEGNTPPRKEQQQQNQQRHCENNRESQEKDDPNNDNDQKNGNVDLNVKIDKFKIALQDSKKARSGFEASVTCDNFRFSCRVGKLN